MSTWSERVPLGKKFISQGRTITEADFTLLHNLTWTLTELHTDREYMKKSQFGEMLLAAPCVLACVVGLGSTSGLKVGQLPGVRGVAALGFEVKLANPVKPGDTITVHTDILDIRPTSRNPERAVLRIRYLAFNQKGEQVMEAIEAGMVETTE